MIISILLGKIDHLACNLCIYLVLCPNPNGQTKMTILIYVVIIYITVTDIVTNFAREWENINIILKKMFNVSKLCWMYYYRISSNTVCEQNDFYWIIGKNTLKMGYTWMKEGLFVQERPSLRYTNKKVTCLNNYMLNIAY